MAWLPHNPSVRSMNICGISSWKPLLPAVLVLLALSFYPGLTADLPLEPRVMRGQSMQFIVQGLPMGAASVQNHSTSQVAYIRVDPALLTVSCERIKQAFLTELATRDEWLGNISVRIHPVQEFDEPIDIITVRHRSGWSYRLEVPDQVERTRLIRAVVQVVMQEMANRRAKHRACELPHWLLEGMTAHLQATTLATLTLEPETSIIQQRQRYVDPAQQVRELLRTRPPLTFNELSWPAEEQLAGQDGEVFRACAQYFVAELLRMKNGRAQLREFFRIMPEYLNWQTAFLQAFAGQFERLLDVDKWWALNIAQLTSRNMMVTWNYDEAFRQLDDALAVKAEVRLQARDLPMNAHVKLQQMLTEWPIHRQNPILLQKINVLESLRFRAPQELIGLVDNYRLVLDTLYRDRQARGAGPFASHLLSKEGLVLNNAVKRLDELDLQCNSLRYLTNTKPAQLSSAPFGANGAVINPARNDQGR